MEKQKIKTPNGEKKHFKSLVIADVKYRTQFTNKFENRKTFEPHNPKHINAFIPGTVKNVFVKKGKKVKEGERLLILDAMKMYNQILSPNDGTIKDIHIDTGDRVAKDQLLIELL